MKTNNASQIVRCCLCKGMMRVANRAHSVFCPHCQKRVNLESLRVLGSHPGKLLATCGDILVERTSWLNLEIKARNVIIRGQVRGTVSASQSVEVSPTGRIFGNVAAPKIIVREGGIVQGRLEMTRTDAMHPANSESPHTVEDHHESLHSEDDQPSLEPMPDTLSQSAAAERLPPQPISIEQIRPIQFD